MSKTKTTPKTCTEQLHHGLHTMRCELPADHDGHHDGEGWQWGEQL